MFQYLGQPNAEAETGSLGGVITFSSAASYWLQRQKITVRQSTYANYNEIVQKHLMPQLGQIPLHNFSPEMLDRLVLEKLSTGHLLYHGGLSPKYVRDIIMILRSILNLSGQLYGVSIPYRLSGLPRKEDLKPRVLEEVERIRLEHLTQISKDWRQQGIFLCLYTGIRIGELCALRWNDFNADKTSLFIQRTTQRIQNVDTPFPKTIVITTLPKSRTSIRVIPLPQVLSKHLIHISKDLPADAFFLTGNSERGLEPRGYQDFFRRFLSRNGFSTVNFHMLRHTFATRCIQSGFDPKALSEILGHACVEITLNCYVHTNMQVKLDYMERLFSVS